MRPFLHDMEAKTTEVGDLNQESKDHQGTLYFDAQLSLKKDPPVQVTADLARDTNHRQNSLETERAEALEQDLYELFSVMIHSGSAASGHYFAYIK